MAHYRYINTIRKPNGELRDWDEYELICRVEWDNDTNKYHASWRHEAVGVIKDHEEQNSIKNKINK